MVHKISVVIFFIIFLLALNGIEARRRKIKSVGKCLDKNGRLKCNSKQVCVNKNKLCQPYDESPKCKCKKLKENETQNKLLDSSRTSNIKFPKGETITAEFPNQETSGFQNVKLKPYRYDQSIHLHNMSHFKVKGCEDMLGRSVCNYNEVCLVKKSGKNCRNKYSKKCKCIVQEVTTPGTTPRTTPSREGCTMFVDRVHIFIPFDFKFHDVREMPCKECMCMPRYPHLVDFCRMKPNCNAALHLVFENS